MVTPLVSDGVLIAAVSSTGGLLAATVTGVFAWLTHRQTQAVKAIAEDTRHHVATNGHGNPENPTMPDRISDVSTQLAGVSDQVAAVARGLEDHVVVGRQAMGEIRTQVVRLARDLERHTDSHVGVPSQKEGR